MAPRSSLADKAARHIASVDPAFEPLIRAVGPFDPRPPDSDAFNSLARAILFQQLAGHAARAIHTRFVNLLGGEVTAENILARSVEDLRSAGLSHAKATSIMDLARKTAEGSVGLGRIAELSDDEIVERLTAVRGIGRWTAEMFLLFQLRRPDVWPVDDFGVRKGYAQVHDLSAPPTPKTLQMLGEPYRPFRSAAAWYCWRAVDTILPTG